MKSNMPNSLSVTEDEMRLIDQFASAALTGLLAGLYSGEKVEDHKQGIADLAYGYALAMIEARRNRRAEIYPK